MEKTATILYSHHDIIEGTGEYKNDNPRYIEYRKKWEELPLKREISKFPLHLDIEITNACNLKCIMCYRKAMKDKEGFMSFELYKKIINQGGMYGLPSVNLSWRGEPLLHPRFFDMVKYAKEHGIIDVRVNTNGTLLDDDKIEKLIESRIDRVIFSFDGSTKGTYESIRVGANFYQVTEKIRKLIRMRNFMKKEKPSVELQIIDMKQTRSEIKKFIEMWRNVVNRIYVVMYRNPFGEEKDEFRVEGKYIKEFPCPQLWQRLVIGWDGKVYKCCGDNKGLTVFWDAKKESLYDIWHSDKLNNIRDLHKHFKFNKIASCKICEFNKYPKTKKRWNG